MSVWHTMLDHFNDSITAASSVPLSRPTAAAGDVMHDALQPAGNGGRGALCTPGQIMVEASLSHGASGHVANIKFHGLMGGHRQDIKTSAGDGK